MTVFVRRLIVSTGAALLAALGVVPAEARVVAVRVDRTEPFADGVAFGASGAYERVVGVARGEVDRRDRANPGIVNLDRSSRNPRGLVEHETDFYLLRPGGPAKGNRKIVYEVNNRGRKLLFLYFMDATTGGNDPRTAADVGDGLLLRQGYTLAWSGWDPGAPRAAGGLAMQAPAASADGRPIVRTIRDELVSGTRGQPVEVFRLSYEAATLDQAAARLTVRRNEAHPASEVPAGEWAYVDARSIRLLPAGTRPGPGTIYDFKYPARDPAVLGLGLAATGDFVAFLRYEPGRAAATCEITSRRASIATRQDAGSSTGCSPTSRAGGACSSTRSSGSRPARTPSTRITWCRRTSSRSRAPASPIRSPAGAARCCAATAPIRG